MNLGQKVNRARAARNLPAMGEHEWRAFYAERPSANLMRSVCFDPAFSLAARRCCRLTFNTAAVLR